MQRAYRMYVIVTYNISEIQKGIQFVHAVVEYGLLYGETRSYQDWAIKDKTFIILNGGTTNTGKDNNFEYTGTLNEIKERIHEFGINYATFYEPDLGDQLTAVVFLLDDRVWDKKKFPDYAGPNFWGGDNQAHHSTLEYKRWLETISRDESIARKIVELRNFIKDYRLA